MNSKSLFISVVLSSLFVMGDGATTLQKLPWSEELQEVLDRGLKTSGGTGVSAAVLVAGTGEWAGVSGISDVKTAECITPEMLFDVASVGKTFTAALALQLAEEGKLSLDDSLHKWLPDFPHISRTATVRQLLNHTSGISHFSKNPRYWSAVFATPDSLWTPLDVLAFVPEPRFPPGGGWHYSSTNYILLGMIIEKATGSALSEQLRSRILIPWRLKNTFPSLDSTASKSRVFAHPHFDLDGDGKLDDMGSLSRNSLFSSGWAAGPVVSTAEDLTRWAECLYGDHVLQKESLQQMTDFYRPTPGEPFLSGYGLGTADLTGELLGGEKVWGHLGWQPGSMTAMLYLPTHSVSIAVLINDNNEACITSLVVGLWGVVKKHL